MDRSSAQQTINAQNADFWNEPCGRNAMRAMGLQDLSPQSIAKFDGWYFSFYPYLLQHVPVEKMGGKKILEVGLGLGSLSQKLASCGADYTGLDIAEEPVRMVRWRLEQNGLPGAAIQGNILDSDFMDETFDYVIAIGCYHHTGDLPKAINETWRILKKGGHAIIMIYSAFSYRQWFNSPLATFGRLLGELHDSYSLQCEQENTRLRYDCSSSGKAAPETVLTSRRQFRKLAQNFTNVKIRAENIEPIYCFKPFGRASACSIFGNFIGLDLYCTCIK